MKGIQCLSSKPMLRGRNIDGSYGKYSIDVPYYLRLYMQLSAIQWRILNGAITLYTDKAMKKYLASYDMLKYWMI